jgi:DNA-binding transcriptional regulator of glucitol operon
MSTPRARRWPLMILVVVAACGCLALAWWQWSRFESTAGTFQNLGYALQWPFFAGFCIYAYRKFVRYEQTPPGLTSTTEITSIPDGVLPQRPQPNASAHDDPVLRDYNAYLAELARKDRPDRTTA